MPTETLNAPTSTNPYEAPKARIDGAKLPAGSPNWFTVSQPKLVAMSVCTLGVYMIYWHYKQWQRWRERTQENIYPFLRALFSIFFTHQLFSKIRGDTIDTNAQNPTSSSSNLATMYVVLVIGARILDRTENLALGMVALACG